MILDSVWCVESTTSTMDLAKQILSQNSDDCLSLVLASEQTAGRGRRGSAWHSGRGGLWCTIIAKAPQSGLHHTFNKGGTLAIGLATARMIEKCGVPCLLKWPNDILSSSGKKLAGVLVEQKGSALFIGVGINISNDISLDTASSLIRELRAQDASASVNTLPLVASQLLHEVATILAQFGREGFASLRGEWIRRCAHCNRALVLNQELQEVRGVCRGVTNNGKLLVEDENETVREFEVGEVRISSLPDPDVFREPYLS